MTAYEQIEELVRKHAAEVGAYCQFATDGGSLADSRNALLAAVKALAEENERLKHYADTCGGSDNDGRCPMHHLLARQSTTSAGEKP
jgi:hypothetical protein